MMKNIFSYTDINPIGIFINIIKLTIYKIVGKRFVTKKICGNKLTLDLKTGGISRFLFIYGKRELLDTDLVKEEIKEGMTVLDVGANIGYYSILEASLVGNGRVYSFEPDPRNLEMLRKNILVNNFSDKIEVYPYAVSDKNEVKKFNLYKETNLSSFENREEEKKTIEVKCIKLDDFDKIDSVDFIRSDIEGAECFLLKGAMDFLTRKKNIKLLIEVHPRYYNDEELNLVAILEKMKNIGFSVDYLISAEIDRPEQIIKAGYSPIKTVREGKYTRGLYKDVKMDDLISFLKSERKIVRSILLRK